MAIERLRRYRRATYCMFCRLVAGVFLFVATILCADGSGLYCYYAGYRRMDHLTVDLGIEYWQQGRYAPYLRGKYFVFIVALIGIFFSGFMGLFRFFKQDRRSEFERIFELAALGIYTIFLVISAALEIWYASGFGELDVDPVDCTIGSWIASSSFLVLASFVYCFDFVLTFPDDEIAGLPFPMFAEIPH